MAKGKGSDHAILIAMGLLLAAAVALLVSLDGMNNSRQSPPVRTTYSSKPEGTMAWWMLAEQLNVPIRRLRQEFTVETLASCNVLIVLEPLTEPSDEELAVLEQWVTDGGVLIRQGSPDLVLPSAWGWLPQGEPLPIRPVPADARDMPLARDVYETCFADFETIPMEQNLRTLFADERGPRIVERRMGDGRIIALADSSFLANGLLGRGDNSVLAMNLLAYATAQSRGGAVACDEYHMAYGSRETGTGALWSAMVGSSAGWGVLVTMLAGAMWLLLNGRRFGTREAPQRARRRSKLEFVRSVGATYRAAKANPLTLRLIATWFKSRCAASVALPATAGTHDLALALAGRTGGEAERYERLLRSFEAASFGQHLSAGAMHQLLEQMAEMEREMFDESQPGK
jgi:hypothetical protein